MLGRIVHQQMNVVVLAVHLNESRFKVSAHTLENDTKVIDSISIKYLPSILCGEDQVNVKFKRAMSTVQYFTLP
jgi:hypothetical protein